MQKLIVIDEEFQAQIPPLSEQERAQLEANILEHGCRDPLVVWCPVPVNGEHKCYGDGACDLIPGDGAWTCRRCDHNPLPMNEVLLDGHNRYAICTQHNIPFDVVEVELDDRGAAADWIDANQLGRRNLTPDDFRLLLGRRYNRAKKAQGFQEAGPGRGKTSRQSDGVFSSTSEALAEQHHVSPRTVERAGRLVAEVEARPELMAAVTARNIGLGLAAEVASLPADEVAAIVAAPPEQLREAAREAVHNHRAQGTGENEWYTPPEYIEAAREFMGGIDLDPASSDVAQATVKASRFYTVDDDGLAQDWRGRVWLNPPYAQPAIAKFVDKAATEAFDECVMLTHNYTDTAWFHTAMRRAAAVCFTRGRIGFLSPEGKKAAPTQGQAFFYFGPRASAFASAFGRFGFVLGPVVTAQ